MTQHPALPFLRNSEKGKIVTAAEAVLLIRDGHLPLALGYGGATLLVGAIGTVAGLAVGARLAPRTELAEPAIVDPETPQ